ncbi:CDP-alcohol phosphatidyltransferase family protein [Paracoccus sp. Z330]|uniref:CDP-alcohol phosphatidyltransferase family protein n=1 Tax=Paracoccus onchidii TaxID=3017813 RepID=A0ABT4ZEE6_9RHOB|nr:CDP-alcohol phosphatidyltransferase family protein [Paracoccus onchidii]MDB6177642.1 CDP-alcohol phosphatidyltransferase family protein [Paracoccus onchidii]
MIDAKILPLQRAVLRPVGVSLKKRGIRADWVSLVGFAIGVFAFVAIAMGQTFLGAGLILANRLFDGVDGAVARAGSPTDRGAFLDIALDFVFYALVPLGFAIDDPAANALPAAILIAAFVGTGSSFLAFAAIAERRKLTTSHYPTKGIYYLGGLTEGFETIVVFVAMCLWPERFAVIASCFATACLLTTLLRWHQGWIVFSPREKG